MFAYLYGVTYDISPIVPFLKERKIDILEDVAESFTGPKNNGHPGATLTMFSFGAIKIQTCVYGGVTVIRDDEPLFNEMKKIQDGYALFTPQMYRKRIYQLMALYYFINTQRGNQMFDIAARLSGQEREEFYVSFSRGFKPGESFIDRFRFRPCAPMMAFIYYRMQKFDAHQFEDYMRKYYVAMDQFTKAGIYCPGYKTKDRAFW